MTSRYLLKREKRRRHNSEDKSKQASKIHEHMVSTMQFMRQKQHKVEKGYEDIHNN